ncbi:MAG: rRNA pseudouridine synthase [Acidimicrobiia bacterium]|nr:rRNA pseudouridine synthase [Acidimicrobiia bacterium]NNF68757.1 rRNA pseudouridine synthase [Acidimicrobiia bacterium]
MERIHKLIARSGLASLRRAEDLITAGRVTVDGRPARIGERVDPATAVVRLDGNRIPVNPDLVHFLAYKPVGVISTAEDTHGRRTVVELVDTDLRVWPVGRLDADSEGLVLVTNDGDLTNLITHPRFGITKTYVVLVDGDPSPSAIRSLSSGVELEDGPARAVAVRELDRHGSRALIEVAMGEGRNREVRRMCDAIGANVISLTRTAIGPLRDGRLSPGQSRRLDPGEVAELYAAAVIADD